MALVPTDLEKFGGLRLDLDPEEVGNGAIDSLNVLYDRVGTRVGSRWGYDVLATVGSSRIPITIAPLAGGGFLSYEIGTTNQYAVRDSTGTVTAALGSGSPDAFSYSAIGIPGSSRLYVADGGILRIDSTGFNIVVPSLGVLSLHVCATSDSRLAYGNITTGPTVSSSRVYFSDPGSPEVIQTNNYVELSPGDGEQITGMVAFREQLIVFKETKFFVFYGNSTDAKGSPIFNYRTVASGIGQIRRNTVHGPAPCVGRDGVYFTNGKSIYRTTGGEAVSVSRVIDPFLRGASLPLFGQTPPTSGPRDVRLRWIDDRLYVILTPTSAPYGTPGMFVWDMQSDAWSFWDVPVTDIVASPSTLLGEEQAWAATTLGQIVRFKATLTSDNGAAINSRLRSGFQDFGKPGQEKVIRQTQVTGQGNINFGWARDFTSASTSAVSLGAAPQVARGLHRVAQRGETLSYTITAAGPWQVNRIVPMLRSIAGPGERTS